MYPFNGEIMASGSHIFSMGTAVVAAGRSCPSTGRSSVLGKWAPGIVSVGQRHLLNKWSPLAFSQQPQLSSRAGRILTPFSNLLESSCPPACRRLDVDMARGRDSPTLLFCTCSEWEVLAIPCEIFCCFIFYMRLQSS